MAELEGLQRLVHDELLVHRLQDVGPDHSMQVRLHEVEDKVDVLVVLGLHEILQRNDVGMFLGRLQRQQVLDLAECALGICLVLEGVKDFFERHHLLGLLVDRLEDDGVRALAELLHDVVASQHVPVDFVARAH